MANDNYHDGMAAGDDGAGGESERWPGETNERGGHGPAASRRNLDDVYRVVRSIEEMVGEIRDDLSDFMTTHSNGYRGLDFLDDDYHPEDGFY